MSAFKDLDEFLDDTLVLPINGKNYTIQAPDAELGLMCSRLIAVGAKAATGVEVTDDEKSKIDDQEEEDLFQRLLGPVWGELLADKVSWPRIKHAGTTAMIWAALGEESAAAFWSSQGPKAPKAPADRKPPAKSGPRASTDSKRRPAKKAAKKATAGRTSSTTGRS